MITFTGSEIFYYTVAFTLFIIAACGIYDRIKNKDKRRAIVDTEKNKELKVPIGFYLSVSNIFLLILCNFLH